MGCFGQKTKGKNKKPVKGYEPSLAAVFLAAVFFAAGFLAAAFLAGAFFVEAFLVADFFAGAFFVSAFFDEAFLRFFGWLFSKPRRLTSMPRRNRRIFHICHFTDEINDFLFKQRCPDRAMASDFSQILKHLLLLTETVERAISPSLSSSCVTSISFLLPTSANTRPVRTRRSAISRYSARKSSSLSLSSI